MACVRVCMCVLVLVQLRAEEVRPKLLKTCTCLGMMLWWRTRVSTQTRAHAPCAYRIGRAQLLFYTTAISCSVRLPYEMEHIHRAAVAAFVDPTNMWSRSI